MLGLHFISFCGDLISIKKQPYGDPNPQHFVVENPRGINQSSIKSSNSNQLDWPSNVGGIFGVILIAVLWGSLSTAYARTVGTSGRLVIMIIFFRIHTVKLNHCLLILRLLLSVLSADSRCKLSPVCRRFTKRKPVLSGHKLNCTPSYRIISWTQKEKKHKLRYPLWGEKFPVDALD